MLGKQRGLGTRALALSERDRGPMGALPLVAGCPWESHLIRAPLSSFQVDANSIYPTGKL